MKKIFPLFILSAVLISLPAFAATIGDNYQENMQNVLVRGFKNVLSAPLEIPVTIQEHHESAGRPVIRQMTGFVDGTFQMLSRAGSGLWDFVAAFIPGYQEGLPVTPETLF